ncbi:putative F-box domain, leucine-rich repeat domain superfamily, F-box-like domain superfamily [Helianthus annuus]|nr:putative F-box domain, leucine-rich repeat domain superfamily, F-box-like domain superfamily [Helianthus annuus]
MGDRKRVNVERDRLSSLGDDLIHKILSLVSTKHAVETSVLSSRWRYIWTSMSCLSLSSNDFCTLLKFSEFVTHVLSGRNNQIEVFSVELTFHSKVSKALFKRILDYAFSHNVQQLNVTYLPGKKTKFPVSLFSSQSLKHLTLIGCIYGHFITTPPTWELPALVTLSLYRVTLYDDYTNKCASLFANCANLKNLTIKRCRMMAPNGFNISHPGLTSLTFEDGCKRVNVDTPQLKNLTIKDWRGIHLICAPILSSLHYKDPYFIHRNDIETFFDDVLVDNGLLQLSTHLLHLEKVEICIHHLYGDKAYTHKIVCLLQKLHSVKSLTLNWEIIKLLTSSMVPSPFANLKSVTIFPAFLEGPEVTISSEVKNYLLDDSPNATFTMILHQGLLTRSMERKW